MTLIKLYNEDVSFYIFGNNSDKLLFNKFKKKTLGNI
jgi:hypothetical protein